MFVEFIFGNIFYTDGNLEKVNFKINGDFYKTDTARPFENTFTPTEPGTYEIAAKVFDKEGLKSLETWIKNGGKVVAIRYAINVFAQSDDFDISKYGSKEEKEQAEKEENNREKEEQLITYNDKERNTISNFITGSIFKASLDNTSPLIKGAAIWALSQLLSKDEYILLQQAHLPHETDPEIIEEWRLGREEIM